MYLNLRCIPQLLARQITVKYQLIESLKNLCMAALLNEQVMHAFHCVGHGCLHTPQVLRNGSALIRSKPPYPFRYERRASRPSLACQI